MNDPVKCRKPYMDREDLHQTADRWMRARRALNAGDRVYAHQLSGMIRSHARNNIAVIKDPLEAAVFAVLIEMLKKSEGE